MMNKVKLYQAERLDLPDVQSMMDFTEAELQEWTRSVLAGVPLSGVPTSYVLQGFIPKNIINLALDVSVADAVLFNTSIETGALAGATYRGEPTAADLPLTLSDNCDNYVHVVISRTSGEADLRVFWDRVANAGEGAEWSQVVNTIDSLSVSLSVSVVGWSSDADKIPIFKATTSGSVVTQIEDYRNLFFRLGKPGNATFTNYLTSRVEPMSPVTVTGGALDDPLAFTGADKEITSLKTWMDTVMTAIKEIKWGSGPNKWYQRASTHLDSTSDILTDGGTWSWYVSDPDGAGPLLANSLYFSADATILLDGGVYSNTIDSTVSSPITLSDGDLAYVVLNRAANAVVVPVVVAGSAYVSDPDHLIIARRIGTFVYIGNTPLVLDDTDTGTLSVSLDVALYNYVGAPSVAPPMPDYNATVPDPVAYITNSVDNLTTAAAKLDNECQILSASMPPVGSIIPWYNYGTGAGAIAGPLNTDYWAYCDGSIVPAVGGLLDGQTTPDLSNRYLVGFGTEGGADISTAAWVTAAVGAASHVVNLQHTHITDISHGHSNTISASMPAHGHSKGTLNISTPSGAHQHTIAAHDSDGFTPRIRCADPDNTQTFLLPSNGWHVHNNSEFSGRVGSSANNGDGSVACTMGGSIAVVTASPESSTPVSSMAATSIQPRSVRVRWIMRIL